MVAEAHHPHDSGQSDDVQDVSLNRVVSLPQSLFIALPLCLAVLLVSLDQSILSTAIPTITNQFQSLGDSAWYSSAYLLGACCFQLIFARIYHNGDEKIVFLSALAIFEIGSVVCGAASSSSMLIVGRLVAGIGSAGIGTGALVILSYLIPLQLRPLLTGAITATTGIAVSLGPLVGGTLTEKASWRWCFYINPICGCVIICPILWFYAKYPPSSRSHEQGLSRCSHFIQQIQIVDNAVFTSTICCFLLALSWGGEKYAWASAPVLILLIFSGVGLGAFVWLQCRQPEAALLPGRIIGVRRVVCAFAQAFLLSGAFLILGYFLPLYFQAIRAASVIQSGIHTLPLTVGVVVCSLLTGLLISTWGYYTPCGVVGSALVVASGFMLTRLQVDASAAQWVGFQATGGIGLGLASEVPIIAIQTVLANTDIEVGLAMVMLCQSLGGSVLLMAAQKIFISRLQGILQTSGLAESGQSLDVVGATSIWEKVQPGERRQFLHKYNEALRLPYYCAAAAALIGFGCALNLGWVSVKKMHR